MLMHVSVNKKPGRIAFDEPAKTFKPSMASILLVVDEARRRVGDDDIHAAPPPYMGREAQDRYPHLTVGVLIGAAVIPARAFETQNIAPLNGCDAGVDVHASLGWFGFMANIMVAAHIQQARMQ